MKKAGIIIYGGMLCTLHSVVFAAGTPITLSTPSPTIVSSMQAGDSQVYAYTLTNITSKAINTYQTVTGNSAAVTVTTACASVPANGTCDLEVTVLPTLVDYNRGNITDVLHVFSNGRDPRELTSSIQVTTIAEPTLTSIVITPSTNTLLGASQNSYIATGTYGSYSENITSDVTWASSAPSVATVGSGNGIVQSLAVGSTNITATRNAVTSNTASVSVLSYLYVANTGNDTVSRCSVNNAGTLSGCVSTGITVTSPTQVSINKLGTYAYIAQSSGTLTKCALDSATGALSGCATTSAPSYTRNITFDAKNRKAYVASSGGAYTCTASSSDGSLTSCKINSEVITSGTSGPVSILLGSSENFAYVLNSTSYGTNALEYCAITSGVLSPCQVFTFSSNQANQMVMAPNNAGFYIANGMSDISYCSINSTTGAITACNSVTGQSNLSTPIGISIKATGDFAYISNDGYASNITECAISGNGTFSSCSLLAPAAVSTPSGVIIR